MAVRFLRVKTGPRVIYPLWNALQTFRLNSENKDSIELFICDITQRSQEKFNQLRKELKRNQLQIDIKTVEGKDLFVIDEIYKCLDNRDADELTRVIDSWLENRINKLPRSVISEALKFSSGAGNRELFEKLIDHAKCSDFYEESSAFIELLNLELDWRTGKNIDQLIEKFDVLYKKSISDEVVTKQLEKLCSLMIRDSVEKKGESVVVKLKEKIEQICGETKDYRLMYDLWRQLFESFWYSDQQIASELISTHPMLRRLLSNQLSFLCFTYLRDNNTEQVNRLIQIFLKFNMMRQTEMLVKTLLDYECWRKNLSAALQIVQLCLKLDIHLSDNENQKFLNLLLNQPNDSTTEPDAKKITIQKYQFKF